MAMEAVFMIVKIFTVFHVCLEAVLSVVQGSLHRELAAIGVHQLLNVYNAPQLIYRLVIYVLMDIMLKKEFARNVHIHTARLAMLTVV